MILNDIITFYQRIFIFLKGKEKKLFLITSINITACHIKSTTKHSTAIPLGCSIHFCTML